MLQRNLPPGLTSYMRLEDLLWELWREQMPDCYRPSTPSSWQPDWAREEREFQPVHPMENPCACFAPPYRWYGVFYWPVHIQASIIQSISLVLPYFNNSNRLDSVHRIDKIVLVEHELPQICDNLSDDHSYVQKSLNISIVLPHKRQTIILTFQQYGYFELSFWWIYDHVPTKRNDWLIRQEGCYNLPDWIMTVVKILNISFSQPFR